jgi:hypothetical protein
MSFKRPNISATKILGLQTINLVTTLTGNKVEFELLTCKLDSTKTKATEFRVLKENVILRLKIPLSHSYRFKREIAN